MTIRTLISVNADLSSSIALRYACQLSSRVDMELATIHVQEPKTDATDVGTGWARHTWENTIIEKNREEISQLIDTEKVQCPVLGTPRFVIGDRDEEILADLQKTKRDLFIEGIVSGGDAGEFYQLIRSKRLRTISCPVILARNLTNFPKVLLLLTEDVEPSALPSAFLKLFRGSTLSIDLAAARFSKTEAQIVTEKENHGPGLRAAIRIFADAGSAPKQICETVGTPSQLAEMFKNYSMVAIALQRPAPRKHPLVEFMARLSCSVLINWV